MTAIPVPAYFVRLAGLLIAPLTAIREVTAGRWNGLRDALILLAAGLAVAYTPDLAQAVLIGWDLGLREGVFELARLAQLRLGPDLIVLLITSITVVVPLKITGRLDLDRALALAAACWMPLFLSRAVGHSLRTVLGLAPAKPIYAPLMVLESPEWIVGLLWLVGLVALAGWDLLRTEPDA